MTPQATSPITLTLHIFFYLLFGFALFFYPTLIYFLFKLTLFFIPLILVLFFTFKLKDSAKIKNTALSPLFKNALLIWLSQTSIFLILLIGICLWCNYFPQTSWNTISFTNQFSLGLIISNSIFVIFLTIISLLMQHFKLGMSINLFFPKNKKMPMLAILGNFCLLKATIVPFFLIFMIALGILLKLFSFQPLVVFIAFLIISVLFITPWFYKKISVWQKNFHFKLMDFFVLFFILFSLLAVGINWWLKPFLYHLPKLNFFFWGTNDLIWIINGMAISLMFSLAFFLSPYLLPLKPKIIFFLALFNPLLYALIIINQQFFLINYLHKINLKQAVILSTCIVIFAYFAFNSRIFTQLNRTFSSKDEFILGSCKKMSRSLIKANLSFCLFTGLALITQAVFMIQAEILTTMLWVFISSLILIYLFLIEKK